MTANSTNHDGTDAQETDAEQSGPFLLQCTDCGIEQTEGDKHTALDLAEGHEHRHGHRVEVEEVEDDE